jgi:Flp pilus assembly secretin CpaC
MEGWRPGRAIGAIVASSVLVCSCSWNRNAPLKKEFDETSRPGTSNVVTEGIAKQETPIEVARPASRASAELEAGESIWIRSGKSRVLQLKSPLRRVSIGDPTLAGIVVLGPKTIMINAKETPMPTEQGGAASAGVGTITAKTLTPEPRVAETTLIIWDGSQVPDIHTLFIADFINQQIMLEVTVAELDRTAMEEHGIEFRNAANAFVSAYFMGGGAGPKPGGTQVLVPPQGGALLPIGTDVNKPTYAFNLPNSDITAFIQIMQAEGLATILAQPKLLAMSGQNAVFQVGGEIPIRIATGFATTVEFKPFGTIVRFVARISDEGDILLTATPEVSEPDFTSLVEGIPSFRTRRASTATRLRDGETLVIGGLLQRNRSENVTGVPYLQDIPVVGYVFRHTTYSDDVTEVMVIVTPRLVKPLAPGTQLALPSDHAPMTLEDIRSRPDPAEVTRPRVPESWNPEEPSSAR